MRIAIVGSGIGGLCAAVGLQRAGAHVTVFERAADLRPGGSGLSIFRNGLTALDALCLGEDFRAISTAQAAQLTGGQRRPDGSWVTVYPMDAVAQLRIVDRADLHQLLTQALRPGTIRPGVEVVQCSPDGSIQFAAQTASQVRGADTPVAGDSAKAGDTPARGNTPACGEHFGLIIGADGLRSTVRRSWPTDPGIAYSGYGAWRGITRRPVDLRGEAGETWGVDARFGLAPLADGRVYWFGVIGAPADQRFAPGPEAVAERFADWHRPIPDLIAATDPDTITYLPIKELSGRLPSFVRGRLALLGDAAHAMTPNLGQGGNQALEDAAVLTRLLRPMLQDSPTASSEVHDSQTQVPHAPDSGVQDGRLIMALHRYDELRRPRTQMVAKRSRIVGQLAHRPGPTLARMRDQLMHLTPTFALRRQLTALQDWRPPA